MAMARARANDGDGERWRALQFHTIRERRKKENLLGTSEREGAMVASQTPRRDGEGEMGLSAWSSTRPDAWRFICNR